MRYDPLWRQKLKAKQVIKDIAALTHVKAKGNSTLCGRYSADGKTHILQFPSSESLPTCRTCREAFQEQLKQQQLCVQN